MNYKPNRQTWKVGDIVIHDADAKVDYMLMRVIELRKAKVGCTIYITEYIDKAYHSHSHDFKNESDPKFIKWNRWENMRPVLHDPKEFKIDFNNIDRG